MEKEYNQNFEKKAKFVFVLIYLGDVVKKNKK